MAYNPLLDTSMNPNLFTSGAQQETQRTYLPPEKQQAFATLNQFLQDPLQNITNRLGPLLRSLIPSEAAARQGYLDVGRRAGALRGGAFAQGARQLEGDIFGRRAETATRASLGALGPMIAGYGTALTGIPALSEAQGTRQGVSQLSPQGGGGAGSDFGGFGFGFSNPPLPPGYNANYGYAGGQAPTGGSNVRYGTGEGMGAQTYWPGAGGDTNYFDPTAFSSGGTAAWDSPSPFDFTGGEQQYNFSGFTPGIYD